MESVNSLKGKIKVSVTKHKPLIDEIPKDWLRFLDLKNMSYTTTRFELPKYPKPINEYDDIMDAVIYDCIGKLIQQTHSIPVKYLEPIPDSYLYTSQKSQNFSTNQGIEYAPLQIEPLNANILQQVSLLMINQSIPIETVFIIDIEIPFNIQNGKLPERRFLRSCDIKTKSDLKKIILKENPDAEYFDLCNQANVFGAIDIGSRYRAKFVVKEGNKGETLSIWHIRRPKDNIIEIITHDYLNTDCKYILEKIKNIIEYYLEKEDYKNKDIYKQFIRILIESLE